MTKGELFEKAWRLGFKGDFHLVDEIYHPDYKAIDHRFGIETNIDSGTIGSNSSKNNTSTTKLPSPTTADTDKFFA